MQVDFFLKSKSKGSLLTRWLCLAAGVGFLGLAANFLSRYQIDVLISPIEQSDSTHSPGAEAQLPPAIAESPAITLPTPGSPLWDPSPQAAPAQVAGVLRVSNPTQHPVRLVILGQTRDGVLDEAPAHWDFAPAEGGAEGLILSLTTGKVKVQPGDILMAYTQDGSSVYWGPYVVGQTPQPRWNNASQEWQIIFHP